MGCTCSFRSIIDTEDFHALYILGEKLGNGNFGQVRCCFDDTNGEQLAVKIVDIRRRSTDKSSRLSRAMQRFDAEARELRRRALQEAVIWQNVGSHMHCVRLHKVFMQEKLCYFVMEICEKSVVRALEEMLPWPVEADLLRIIYEMLLALRHLSVVAVAHRDMKPDNFLLGGSTGLVTKLCDYGLSAMVPPSGRLQGVVGTPPYMCPEMINGYTYTVKADMWSLGAAAYVMLYGKFPYEPEVRSTAHMKRIISRGYPAPEYLPIEGYPQPSKLAERVVRALLVRSPEKREEVGRALDSPLGQELQKALLDRDDISPDKSASFLPVVLAAEMQIKDFREPPADPTVQHSIDEILAWQRMYAPRARSFSDTLTTFVSSQARSPCETPRGDSSKSMGSPRSLCVDSNGSTCSGGPSRPSSAPWRRFTSPPGSSVETWSPQESLAWSPLCKGKVPLSPDVKMRSSKLDVKNFEGVLPGEMASVTKDEGFAHDVLPAASQDRPTLLERQGCRPKHNSNSTLDVKSETDDRGLQPDGVLE